VKNSLLDVVFCSSEFFRSLQERGFCDLMWGCPEDGSELNIPS
jgi:hypothetical protein